MVNTWTVVEFLDQSVEAVPSHWITNNKCSWPHYLKEQLLKAIKHCENPKDDWTQHEVTIFRNATYGFDTYSFFLILLIKPILLGDYSLARRKARKAEDTSDLNSELESSKRMPKVNPRFVRSESSESDSDIESQSSHKEVVKFPQISIFKPRESLVNETNSCADYGLPSIPKIGKETTRASFTMSENSNQECSCCPVHKKAGDNSNGLLQQIYRKVSLLELKINELTFKIDNMSVSPEVNLDIWANFKLPSLDVSDFEEFEEYLNVPENIKQSALFLVKVGGDSCDEFVKRALMKLVTYQVASNFSFLGMKGKKVFKNLNIFKLLLSAGEHTNFKEKEIEDSIKKFLKRSKERAVAEEKKMNNNY
ncbi:unnamed protein product [Psylliodes chrysocephalus]|uniref:DUF4806 domain-containing protein n=1 Tax=Psylliodes chrysocephalus TaxID=3402493 RepID=A0A9P0D8Q5_9CUCU|nr:unnamed protein product [Psylliodes chrysocephala]